MAGRKCKHVRTDTGKQCGNWAMKGQLVCASHGGGGARAKAKGALVIAGERAQKMLARLDVPPCEDALSELQRVTGQIIAWKDVCARIVNQLAETDLRYTSSAQLEQIRGEVQLWERSLDRAVQALTGLARVQVDERLTSIKERDRDDIAAAISLTLADVGMGEAEQNKARLFFGHHLRAIRARRGAA